MMIQPGILAGWQELYDKYAPLLMPNRLSSLVVLEYVQESYALREIQSIQAMKVVQNNVMKNPQIKAKLTPGQPLDIQVFEVLEEGKGKQLYARQEAEHVKTMELLQEAMMDFSPYDYAPSPITIGVEHNSGYFYVEGSQQLFDEVIMYQGLDEEDLKNTYLVADYVETLIKHNRLDAVLDMAKESKREEENETEDEK